VATHQNRLAHVFTSKDPDLAWITGAWDRLTSECKAKLIAVVRENLLD